MKTRLLALEALANGESLEEVVAGGDPLTKIGGWIEATADFDPDAHGITPRRRSFESVSINATT